VGQSSQRFRLSGKGCMRELLKIIEARQTTRSPYEARRKIAKRDLGYILEAARWAPTPHNMQNFEIVVVEDKKILETIGRIKFVTSDRFIKENCENLCYSEEELIEKKTGIMVTGFPPAMRKAGAKLDEAFYEERRSGIKRSIECSSVLIAVIYDPRRRAPASRRDFLGILGLGCTLENMWLMAHSLGVSLQIMSSLFIYPEIEKEVKDILNIPDELRIAFVFRAGYPLKTETRYLRVRREVKDFTHRNQFGHHWSQNS
jgi:nitroreductase